MTRVIILAAGQGTRLKPLTDDKPKCLVKIMGRSLLSRQLDVLKAAGIMDIHIVAGYKAPLIEALGYPCTINEKFEMTNMVETLFSALSFIKKEGDLIVSYGDIIYQQNNLETLLSCSDDICLMIDKNWKALWELRSDNPLNDAETLLLDSDEYVIELGKKPKGYKQIQGQYTGLIKIKSSKLNELIDFYQALDRNAIYDGEDFQNMYLTSFIQELIYAGWKIKAALVSNGWLEVDTISDLEKYEEMQKEGTLREFCILEN